MEQENKHKTKRAIAIAGIATLSAFALIGLFAIGAIIGGCASANKVPEEAPSSIQEERRALAASEGDAGEPTDLLAGSTWYNFIFNTENNVTTISYNGNWKGTTLNLASGVYRFTYDNLSSVWGVTQTFADNIRFFDSPTSATFSIDASNAPVEKFIDQPTGVKASYLSLPSGLYMFWAASWASLELVDTLEVPPSAVVTLPEEWNPTAWVSDEAIGGYPVVHGSYTTEANASGAYVRVGWANVVFKTASDSAVFTSLQVRYRWLWNGQKYRINDQTLTYAYSSEMALLYPVSVSFLDPLTNTWTIVAKEAQDVIGGEYVHTGKLNWLYPTYRTLGFLDYPQNPTSPTIRFYHSGEAGSGEATWQPTPTLQGLTFFDWFGLASWNSPQSVDVGTGNAIGLISTAFTGMVPILGISIFPNITLGLLLFLPLIGGIIVLIIKAVSK